MDKLKTKKCIICGDNFTQYNTTQKVCNWKCALQFASEKNTEKKNANLIMMQ